MRISDWSSDVCSSDLAPETVGRTKAAFQIARDRQKAPARLGQPDLAAITNEQRRSDEFFEVGDPRRQRRMGHADAQRGLRDDAGIDDGEKRADMRALYHKVFLCKTLPCFKLHMRKFW